MAAAVAEERNYTGKAWKGEPRVYIGREFRNYGSNQEAIVIGKIANRNEDVYGITLWEVQNADGTLEAIYEDIIMNYIWIKEYYGLRLGEDISTYPIPKWEKFGGGGQEELASQFFGEGFKNRNRNIERYTTPTPSGGGNSSLCKILFWVILAIILIICAYLGYCIYNVYKSLAIAKI